MVFVVAQVSKCNVVDVLVDNIIKAAPEGDGRAGVHAGAGVVGFAKALEITAAEHDSESRRQREFRDYAIDRILTEIPHARLNGHARQRLDNNINVSFEFIEGEGMLLRLAMYGICASSGSACTSGSLDPSHVLLAIGLPHEKAHGSLRLTLGNETTREDIDFVCDKLVGIVAGLRMMSPLWEDFCKANK